MASSVTQRPKTETRDLKRQVTQKIESAGIKQVRIVTIDMNGVPRAKMVTADRFVGHTIEHGHAWALPLLAVDIWQNLPDRTGFGEEIGYGNGLLIPDLTTFRQLPWAPDTGHVFCDMVTRDHVGVPTPRQVLARVLEHATKTGYEPVFGSESEFYIFRPVDESKPSNPGFAPLQGMQVWFTDQGIGQMHKLLSEIQEHLLALEIPIYEVFNEHGGGQYELNLAPATGMAALDAVALMRIAVKEICYRNGVRATFLGKITNDPEFPVSGYHLHQSLLDGQGKNVFADPSAPIGLSATGRQYIAGVLEHSAAITAIAAPTITAYKRFTPGTWAPTRMSWGFDNRTAMLRVVVGTQGLHFENRLGSGEASPYLLAAIQTAAGLDGIKRKADPGEPGSGNLLEDQRFPIIPATMIEAIEAFEKDPFMADALGGDFTRLYAALLRYVWRRFLSYVTDWEIQEYRDLL